MSKFDTVVTQPQGMIVMTQPGIQQGMMVTSIEGHREWSTGLFDCFSDMKTCLCGWCCLPCALCTISSRQGDCTLMPCCVQGAILVLRTRIRTLGGIRGSICNDCMVTACCGQCAVCQMMREMDNMGL